MQNLIVLGLATLAFVGGHFLLAAPRLRPAIIARTGERIYLAGYSLLSVLLLLWMIHAYRVAPPLVLWSAGVAGRILALLLMPLALILVVAGLSSANPTLVRGDQIRAPTIPVRGVITITRHPFLCGAALWALLHLMVNGDAGSVIFFGGFAVLSIGGMAAIDHKRALKLGERWREFVAHTSRLPFAAAFGGRTRIDWKGIGWLRPAGGIVLYAILLLTHGRLFGVPAIMH